MNRFVDWITGRTKAAAEIEKAAQLRAERYAQQDAALDRVAAQQPKPIRRVKDEARPGETLLPAEVARMRDMHDNPRSTGPTRPAEPQQRAQEATRMAYTVTPQSGPSMGGPGKPFVNTRVKRPSIWSTDITNASNNSNNSNNSTSSQANNQAQDNDMKPDPSDGRTR